MLIKQIEYFRSVVDNNSFTEAAEKHYISQSAISQQINALEKNLGVKLLNRKNRTFTLTAAGDYFYHHSETILKDIDSLIQETINRAENSDEHLKIGYLHWYDGTEMQNSIAQFSELYPEVSIEIINGEHEWLYQLLVTNEVDMVLSDQRRVFSEDYHNYHLLYCHCYVELSNRHPLSNQEYISIEQLKKETCIIIASKDQRDNEREFYENILGFKGSFLYTDNLEAARLMVINNRGFIPFESIGVLPPLNLSIQRILLHKNNKPLKRNYCAFWSKNKTDYYIEEFVHILKKNLSN